MRRTLIIGGVLVLVIVIISYVTWALMRPVPAPTASGETPNIFTRLFPFGAGSQTNTSGTGGVTNEEPGTNPEVSVPRLRQVSTKPTSGGFAYPVGTTTDIMIRYVDRETGNVYETPADHTTAVRISNTTVPGIEEVLWASADDFIVRSLAPTGQIQNFHAHLAAGKTDQSLTGAFLGSWVRGVIDPAGKSLVTVTTSANGTVIASGKSDGSGAKTIFTSPLVSWVPLVSTNAVYVMTAPSSGILGFLYKLSGGALGKIVGDVPGLLALPSPSGRYIAFSSGVGNSVTLSLFDTKTNTYSVSPLGTLATKCAWETETTPTLVCGVPSNLAGSLPDDWLLGRVTFSDSIWEIHPVDGTTTLLSDPTKDAGASLDVWQPKIDAKGRYVTFINKKDLTYWSLRIQK